MTSQLFASFKNRLKRGLEAHGLYVRKVSGLPAGFDLFVDLQRHLRPSEVSTVLDVGAHVGESALRYAEGFPKARIFSFEPVRANFDRLVGNVSEEPRITCSNMAMGDRSGRTRILLQADSQAHSLNPLAEEGAVGAEEVSVSTIDEFMRKAELCEVDLLKIDVEGYETKVLAGAASTLAARKVRSILIEATLDRGDSVHTQLEDIEEALKPFDFNLFALYDQIVWSRPQRLAYFNALFVRSGLACV